MADIHSRQNLCARFLALAAAGALCLGIACSSAQAAEPDPAQNAALVALQHKCPGGKIWRTAVFQGGSLPDFQRIFRQMYFALGAKGLISTLSSLNPEFNFDEDGNYARLAAQSQQGCLQFVPDALYDAGWNEETEQKNAASLKERLQTRQDLDMVWALGSRAGLDVANEPAPVPVLVIDASTPAAAGIIGYGEFSNRKNVHVQKEVQRYNAELNLFHSIFGFRKLGVIIDQNPRNLAGQSWPIVEQTAQDLGFEIVPCIGYVIGDDAKRASEEFARCCLELADKAEAVYIPVCSDSATTSLADKLHPLIANNIPVFSQAGETDVARGALMAMSSSDMREAGQFEADVVEKIMHGTPPEKISQFFYSPLSLVLNLQTARLMGWKPPFEMLIAVDKVYQSTSYE